MSSPLSRISIESPGVLGLVGETSAQDTDPRTALVLENAVWDRQGRICARKGWTDVTTSGGHSDPIQASFLYVESATATSTITAAAAKLYEGRVSLADITGALTPSSDDWQFMNYNGKCIGVQAGETPIVFTGTGNFAAITAGSGSLPTGNCGTSAFGRLWVTDSDERTIKFSGLLDETDWGGAGAGSLDTAEVWPDGLDTVIAIAEWQDRLVIFGKRSVLIYVGPEDPTASTFVLDDILRIGCVSRDSVAAANNDLLWLAPDGLRAMSRAIEYTNITQGDLAPHLRQEIVRDLQSAGVTASNTKAVYSRREGFYLCRMNDRYWAFDLSQGQARASKWLGCSWVSASLLDDGGLSFGQTGVVGTYDEYTDDGSAYTFRYRSSFLDLAQGREVYPKSGRAIIATDGDYGMLMSLNFDYGSDEYASQTQLPATRNAAEWQPVNVEVTVNPTYHEWGTAEWSGGSTSIQAVDFDLGGAGSLVQFGINAKINGYSLCLQRIDTYMRLGRVAA